MEQQIVQVRYEVLAGEGEDAFAFVQKEQENFLCVTDGCGGLGSRRYAALQNHTGAYAAARIAAHCFETWAMDGLCWPLSGEECSELEQRMNHHLQSFALQYCTQKKSRIAGSMQRTLPTTLCAAAQRGNDACFWWAGDSRGYVLDGEGLHQYTRDHLRSNADAFEMLYQDAPLSNVLCADRAGFIQSRYVKLKQPCLLLVATDGVYSSLPTPMELEMLLLDTLKPSCSITDWQKRFQRRVALAAQDDATMLALSVGFESFDQIKNTLLPRRNVLQKQWITPVRRRRGDLNFAKEKWLQYKTAYDCTEAKDE